MATARKYLFDISFDEAAIARAAEPAPPPEEKFSRAELEAAQHVARSEGHSAGLAEAQAATAAKAATALEVVAKGISVLIATQDAAVAQTQGDAIAALRVIVAKALPALAAKGAVPEIEAFVKKCLAEALDEPRVVLRVANDVYEPVCSQIEAMAAATGYPGRIVLLADETLAGGDARLEWADGGAERKLDQLLGEVDAAMTRNVDPAAAAIPPSPSGDNA